MSKIDEQDFVVVDKHDIPSEPATSPTGRVVAEIRAWIQPTDYLGESSDFKKHLSSYVPGTGEWIQHTEQYQQWHSSTTHGALWLKAIAGAGKSVLAARLISHLQTSESKTPVLFFFFRQIVEANHGMHALVRDWMAQLLDYSPHLVVQLKSLKQGKRDVLDISINELWKILLDTFNSLDRVYCVADALDELDSDQTDDSLQRLLAMGQSRPDAVKLLITSRPLPQIQKVLNTPSLLEVRLEDRQVNQDISVYIQHRLLQADRISQATRETIRRSIEDHVHPSFLYARLMLNELLEEHKAESVGIASVQKALLSLPANLEDMYTQMLDDHSNLASVPQERQLLILQLATHASRPLRLLEIATVLDFLDMNDGKSKHGDTKNLTRMSCGPLLEILEDETVSIIHHSFTEFLTDASRKDQSGTGDSHTTFPVLDSIQTHALLALLCLKYILSGPLSSWKLSIQKGFVFRAKILSPQQQSLQLQYPFLAYAIKNWYYHIRRLPEVNGELLENLKTFMRGDNPVFLAWINVEVQPQCAIESYSPIHIAAWAGIASVVKELVSTGQDINALNGEENTPLALAARNGHSDIVARLLKHGARPDEPNDHGLKPLHFAASANHYTTVQVLLDAGVSPVTPKTKEDPGGYRCGNARTTVGDSPLMYASNAGCVETVRVMLPHLTEENRNASLRWAVSSGHLALVKLLLESSDFDLKSDMGGQRLFDAAANIDLKIMELLISKGADPAYQPNLMHPFAAPVSIVDGELRTEDASLLLAICGFINRSYIHRKDAQTLERCLDIALAAGCDVNLQGMGGQTALHYCVSTGASIVEQLLQYGADVHAHDHQGNTPLHLFRPSAERAPILDVLIRYGARWDVIRKSDGKTPLHTCVEYGALKLDIRCMQPYVKDWNVTDSRGNTPLHLLRQGDEDGRHCLKHLIEFGADVNRKNHLGEVPLHKLPDKFITTLLATGADIEARDNKGRTWFLRSAVGSQYQPEKTLQKCLDLGANLHATDDEGNGALHLACNSHRSINSIKFLLKAGADPLHVNHRGDTLLHSLMRHCFRYTYGSFQDILDLIVATGIPLQARNHRGETLLHVVCNVKPTDTASILDPKENPIDSLPQSEVAAIIRTADNDGRMPIHVAAATSEDMIAWLIHKGADLSARTHRRQNVLHLAASAKQSNIIGFLLETYVDASRRDEFLNQQDEHGHTPLQYACRSGRTESVQVLLSAGANVNIRDNDGYTPLHMCADFVKHEQAEDNQSSRHNRFRISSDDEVLRVTEIVHLLCQQGADVMALDNDRNTPLEVAVEKGREEMVIALITEMQSPSNTAGLSDQAAELYLTSRHTSSSPIAVKIANSRALKRGLSSTCERLLKLGAYGVLEELGSQGVEFRTEDPNKNKKDFLETLALWGFRDLFEKLGKYRENTEWINGSVSLPYNVHRDIRPFILTIASRELPSMDLFRVAVETFRADLNRQIHINVHSGQADGTVLHILARGNHWWQTEAIRYVLHHGADVDMEDMDGRTALHCAVKGGYRRLGIVKALLEYGAKPNALDNKGNTPLNLAISDVGIVRLLIQYGANITLGETPILYTAIEQLNMDMVRAILDSGVDCNQVFRENLSLSPADKKETSSIRVRKELEKTKKLQYRPLHLAALVASGDGGESENARKAAVIMQLLLDHGADAFLPVEGDTTMIHRLLSLDAVVEPLLELPGLNLEQRDQRGRSLVLAACDAHTENFLGERSDRLGRSTVKLVRRLCEMGADLSAVNKNRNNALHLLIQCIERSDKRESTYELLTWLIEKYPPLLHQRNDQGYKPFHLAVKRLQVITMQRLLSAGADALETDPDGNTSLHYLAHSLAVKDWQTTWKFLEQVLQLGLDINARNNNGNTPVSEYFLSGGGLGAALGDEMNVENIKRLQNAGADFLSRNNDGESLLHLVAQSPSKGCRWARDDQSDKCFKRLVDMGLDPFQEDIQQRTPVDVAAAYGKTAILALFQKTSVDATEGKTKSRMTPSWTINC